MARTFGFSVRSTSVVTELEEVPDVDRRRTGHPSKAADIRLPGGGNRAVAAGPDRAGRPRTPGQVVDPVRGRGRGGVRVRGGDRMAVRRGTDAGGRRAAASGRAG